MVSKLDILLFFDYFTSAIISSMDEDFMRLWFLTVSSVPVVTFCLNSSLKCSFYAIRIPSIWLIPSLFLWERFTDEGFAWFYKFWIAFNFFLKALSSLSFSNFLCFLLQILPAYILFTSLNVYFFLFFFFFFLCISY